MHPFLYSILHNTLQHTCKLSWGIYQFDIIPHTSYLITPIIQLIGGIKMKTLIKIIAVCTLVLTITTIVNNNNTHALDTVSGATNGTDCTDQTWYCAADWEALGYTWNGSYYVPGTTQVTTPTTTTKAPTTTPVTESGVTTTTPIETTVPSDTSATVGIETQAPVTETTPVVTTPVSTEVEIIEDDLDLNLPLLGGLLLVVAVAGFFVFSRFGNKDIK